MKRKYFIRGMGLGIFVTALLFFVAMMFYHPSMSESDIRREAEKLGMTDATSERLNTTAEKTQDEKALETEKEIAQKSDKAQKKKEEAVASKEQADKEKEEAEQKKEETEKRKQEAEQKKQEAEQKKQEANEAVQTAQNEEQSAAERIIEQHNANQSASDSSETVSYSNTSQTENEEVPSPVPAVNESVLSPESAAGADEGAGAESASGEIVDFSVQSGQTSAVVGANLYKAGLVDDADDFDRYLVQHNYDNNIQHGSFSIKKGSTYEEIAKILTRQ